MISSEGLCGDRRSCKGKELQLEEWVAVPVSSLDVVVVTT